MLSLLANKRLKNGQHIARTARIATGEPPKKKNTSKRKNARERASERAREREKRTNSIFKSNLITFLMRFKSV